MVAPSTMTVRVPMPTLRFQQLVAQDSPAPPWAPAHHWAVDAVSMPASSTKPSLSDCTSNFLESPLWRSPTHDPGASSPPPRTHFALQPPILSEPVAAPTSRLDPSEIGIANNFPRICDPLPWQCETFPGPCGPREILGPEAHAFSILSSVPPTRWVQALIALPLTLAEQRAAADALLVFSHGAVLQRTPYAPGWLLSANEEYLFVGVQTAELAIRQGEFQDAYSIIVRCATWVTPRTRQRFATHYSVFQQAQPQTWHAACMEAYLSQLSAGRTAMSAESYLAEHSLLAQLKDADQPGDPRLLGGRVQGADQPGDPRLLVGRVQGADQPGDPRLLVGRVQGADQPGDPRLLGGVVQGADQPGDPRHRRAACHQGAARHQGGARHRRAVRHQGGARHRQGAIDQLRDIKEARAIDEVPSTSCATSRRCLSSPRRASSRKSAPSTRCPPSTSC
jgi:hypothetical protein